MTPIEFANRFTHDILTIYVKLPSHRKEALMELGELAYQVTYSLTDDDKQALRTLYNILQAATTEEAVVFRDILWDPSNRFEAIYSAARANAP
jgi:hypothetical protein